MSKPITICLVEDDQQLLRLLERLLGREGDLHVVGAFADPKQALERVDWSAVQVLLTDLDMPGLSGVEVIRAAREANPELLAMAYTVCENRQTVYAAIQAGAFGYILKDSPVEEIRDAIHNLLEGGSPMSPSIARTVLRDFQSARGDRAIVEELTDREVEVLRLIATGLLYKEVADKLGISTHTVHTFLKRVYAKLHVNNRRAAVRVAREVGLVD